LYTDVFRFKYMFNVSIRECFSVLNMSIVCIRNTARSKSIPLLCTHVDPHKFSSVHPPRVPIEKLNNDRFDECYPTKTLGNDAQFCGDFSGIDKGGGSYCFPYQKINSCHIYI
jgi:hypothetical protein